LNFTPIYASIFLKGATMIKEEIVYKVKSEDKIELFYKLGKELFGAELKGVDLHKADLTKADLSFAKLNQANL
jgi:uncharacterized protein YjbI with pentapeptide repeats